MVDSLFTHQAVSGAPIGSASRNCVSIILFETIKAGTRNKKLKKRRGGFANPTSRPPLASAWAESGGLVISCDLS